MTPATASSPLSTPVTRLASGRLFNFSAGPACLPEEVLKQVQQDVWDIRGTGIGMLEHSHRMPTFDAVLAEAFADCKALFGKQWSNDYEVVFLPGGATMQFAMIPLNWLPVGRIADYPDTGVWTSKAIADAQRFDPTLIGKVHVAFEGKKTKYDHVPDASELSLTPNAAYFHYCSNNTVYGTRYATTPVTSAPLICDASSEMFARPHDLGKHAMIYASGQKTLGPSGMVLVILRKDFLAKARTGLPSMFDYREYVAGESRPNTPPAFGIYLMGLMFKWIARAGGTAGLEKLNADKAALLYDVIDRSGGFYTGLARKDSRSHMNVSFRLPSDDLNQRFAKEATAAGLDGLKGHKDAGGIRASIYSAFPREGCVVLAQFMREFNARNG